MKMKYLIMLVVVSSCKQVDNSIVYQLEAGNGIVVQIHNNFEITTKLNNLKNSIVLDSLKMSNYESDFNKEFRFYNSNEKFSVINLNNCKYPAIFIRRRIHNGSTENALQTVVLGYKGDRYKVIGYQLNMLHLTIENEYLILSDSGQIVVKKNFQNNKEVGKQIGTYKQNYIECDSIYNNHFIITSNEYKYLENYLFSVSTKSCF